MNNWVAAADPDPAEPPNTVKRRRSSNGPPDGIAIGGMEGSAKDASPQVNRTSSIASTGGDVDTCRICRGEATATEPLFYPCKCSGSIKYVHQDCLMEWLSHSQKKHCELCKTPFRFTKLYSPDMPQRLPIYVFVSHMAKYLFRNIIVWLRAALVTSVWLGWLPYLMRSVWSFLFWISDEGFGNGSDFRENRLRHTETALTSLASGTMMQGFESTVCPSSPLLPTTMSAASQRDIVEQLPALVRVFSTPLKLDVRDGGSFGVSLMRMLFGGVLSIPENTDELLVNNTSEVAKITVDVGPRHSTLLGNVNFLTHLTRHSVVNRVVVAVLEGQIITVLVIISFILIILVRDYVVQQQPDINMRAAFAAEENNVQDAAEEAPEPELRGPDSEDEDDDSLAVQVDRQEDQLPNGQTAEQMNAHVEQQQRPIAGFRRRLTRRGTLEGRQNGAPPPPDTATEQSNRDSIETLLRDPVDDKSESTINQYLRIYREAGGDREKILRIIHNEGLEERLAYWVSVTKNMGTPSNGAVNTSANIHRLVNLEDESQASSSHILPNSEARLATNKESYLGVDNMDWARSTPRGEADDGGDHKGKGKAVNSSPNAATKGEGVPDVSKSEWGKRWNEAPRSPAETPLSFPEVSSRPFMVQPIRPSDFAPPSSRPRAVSDGPQGQKTINPLANNNWSFANLPANPDTDATDRKSALEDSVDATPQQSNEDASGSPEELGQPASGPTSGIAHDGHVIGGFVASERAEAESPRPPELQESSEDAMEGVEHEDVEAAHAARQPAGIVDRVADFMFAEVDADEADAENNVIDMFVDDEDAPFVEANREDDLDEQDEAEMAPDVVEAAVAAGIDPEAMDDAEDFEGIMELIGMRGPIAGLFQNAIFCAFLVSITVFLGVFLPYNIGRLALWVVANPSRLLRMVFSFSKVIQDVLLLAVGGTTQIMFEGLHLIWKLCSIDQGRELLTSAAADARSLTTGSVNRITEGFMSEIPMVFASETRNFSALSHEALIQVKSQIGLTVSASGRLIAFLCDGDYATKWAVAKETVATAAPSTWEMLRNVTVTAMQSSSWMISLDFPETTSALPPDLAYWDARDRTLAIFGGYITIAVLAALYLGRGVPFSSSQTAQEWEASIIDALNQASGVVKVILIISIEMLIFPLYCGLLLDFALLPLFENTSLTSRLYFTYNYPLTSIFVHWFVGTGYMFHFALFVSMCRKIMRRGVLYFIRDPDDPEFHPVRDVLERNVMTQLRKIMFSAFVYGALVVVCLGGVVWGLRLALPNVLLIHYTSDEPVLEFPVDLLFYNFLMPLAIKFFKPSDGLHAMYTWWFRRCARSLRLTWFLFGERRVDEEGALRLAGDSENNAKPWYLRALLEVNKDNTVVPMSWSDTFKGGKAKPTFKISPDEMAHMNEQKSKLVGSGQLIPNGRFVRSPASDQVKIPKGQSVFQDVPESDIASDLTEADSSHDHDHHHHDLDDVDRVPRLGAHTSRREDYQCVYIPPFFRVRIFAFIMCIWIFAAITGVGITILPLIFGRKMFRILIPAHIHTNDIYAFSIGIYILGSLSYFVFHIKPFLTRVSNWAQNTAQDMRGRDVVERVLQTIWKGITLGYTYTTLLLVFPLVTTLLVELYLLMPLHTWMYPESWLAQQNAPAPPPTGHTIRVIQAWTLGILYIKLASRALVMGGGRPANAVRAVLRRGWHDPDVGVLTRAFVVPFLTVSAVLILLPPYLTKFLMAHNLVTLTPPDLSLADALNPVASLLTQDQIQMQKVWITRDALVF